MERPQIWRGKVVGLIGPPGPLEQGHMDVVRAPLQSGEAVNWLLLGRSQKWQK
jgi:hypothetical protein